jgi:hypothetical protein
VRLVSAAQVLVPVSIGAGATGSLIARRSMGPPARRPVGSLELRRVQAEAEATGRSGQLARTRARGRLAALAAAVLAVAVPATPQAQANAIGMNGPGPLDWQKGRVYADVIRTARAFWKPKQIGAVRASVDANGWPTEDFALEIAAGIDKMHGRYTLYFTGRAREIPWFENVTYDTATNTTTATLDHLLQGETYLVLEMIGTRRSPTSPLGSGVTNIKLLRPTAPGAKTSYPPSTLFHAPLQQLLRKFAVVRWMDFTSTNGNQQVAWSDRPLPSWPTVSRLDPAYGWEGVGAPWEHVVRYSNEIQRDAWINVPAKANDEYVLKLARLIRYGSDGVNPYTSPQARPIHPPLDPALKVYVEYSNEVWNFGAGFQAQSEFNRGQALAEVAAGRSPLVFDGLSDPSGYVIGWRRIAKRGVEISRIFRSVFGDAAMMTRVRPVLMTQQADAQETFYQAARLLHGYYNNGEGDFVSDPRPPGYYFYGAGGSGYYGPDGADRALTLDGIWRSATMSPAAWGRDLRKEADWSAALGVRRVCYEGGPSLDNTGAGDAVKQAAWGDPRMTAAIVANHDAWSSYGSDLFVYYQIVGDHQWGFVKDVLSPDTAKMRAVDALAASARAPVTHGTSVPGSIEGGAFSVSCQNWRRPRAGGQAFAAGNPKERFSWASYTLRSPERRRVAVELAVSSARGARIVAYWDGRFAGVIDATDGSSRPAIGELEATPGLHGLIVRAAAGSFVLDAIRVR